MLKVMLLKRLELSNCAKQVDELSDTAAEKIELAENLSRVKVKLTGLRHRLEALLCEVILLDVGFLEALAALKHDNQLVVRVLSLVPKAIVLKGGGDLNFGVGQGAHLTLAREAKLNVPEVDDVVLAVCNHLIGDFDEKASHALRRIVIARDGVNHLDRVHKGWQSLLDRLGVTDVERLEVLLEGLEVLDVVLGLRKRLSDLVVDASPVGGCHVDLLVVDAELVLHLVAGLVEQVINGAAILATELFRDLGQLSHTLLPVVELLDGAIILAKAALSISVLDVCIDFVLPSTEDECIVLDETELLGAALSDALALIFAELVENDVALE